MPGLSRETTCPQQPARQRIAMLATDRLSLYQPWLWLFCSVLLCGLAGAFPPLSSDCDLECPAEEENSGPVCGNDGRTYGSRCEVERVQCQGLPIQVKHEGKCATERARCAAQRAALLMSQSDERGLFVPECHEDGSYAEVQCHASTGYCWCVDRQGKPIRGSSIQHARPVCTAHQGKGRKTNKRRSSRGRKNKKGCGTSDRANFNANLIDIFQSEYGRVDHPSNEDQTAGTSDPLRDTHEKRVVQWKFDQLDSDGDSALHRSEVRDLRRMARRIVRPRGCARTFAKFCDLDQDKRISRAEWAVCVGVDINNEQGGRLEDFLDDQPKMPDKPEETDPGSQLSSEPWDRESHVPRLYQITPDTNDEEKEIPKEDELQDCTTARTAALEIDRQAPGAGTYVPECTQSGDYARAQCHRSPPYCWCVHPRTGRPIRGTATQGVKPDCDSMKAKTKNFKGCSLHKKQEFLDELIRSFSKEIKEDARNKSISIDNPTPEKAARWKFSNADSNSNGVLDKREWKIFKTEWRTLQKDSRLKRRLRKCWRNLPRFCDENANQKITMDEWLACTVTTRDSKSNLPRNHRRGKNPLTTILKSD